MPFNSFPQKINSTLEQIAQPTPLALSTAEKIALFRKLFYGRTDVYPVRWESKTTQKSGYAPACGNEWRAGICEKPKIKCGDCNHRLLLPLSDQVIYDHLAGKQTIGLYPLLADDGCHLLAVDFDEAQWQEDIKAFASTCKTFDVPVALEISRSGNGAHAWIFFDSKVAARDARRLGAALISYTCNKSRQLKLASYDRLFPNQDTLPKGGFGNLIALPLQKTPRENGRSVFVDESLTPYLDQWAFLAKVRTFSPADIETTILQATGNVHPLDVSFIEDEDLKEPWQRSLPASNALKLAGDMPKVVTMTLSNLIYFEKARMPQSLMNRLIRLAAFQNPEFYKAQAMRLSVWDKPRIIGCAENFPDHIALPRGCLEAAQALLKANAIGCHVEDLRNKGESVPMHFTGTLRAEQEQTVEAMLQHEIGVLCAPTAFGKTVIAAAIMARRGVNTLILVHRTELLKQWQERLQMFIAIEDGSLGWMGGGKTKLTNKIDIAVMQSLSRHGEINPVAESYGHIIVDECHHIGAVSFDAILRKAKATYVLGLSATPVRRDGQQPIIFMQCGAIRHKAVTSNQAPQDLVVIPCVHDVPLGTTKDASIQDIFQIIAQDMARTEAITQQVVLAVKAGRKIMVLTERTNHVQAITDALAKAGFAPFVLHGRLSKRLRATVIAELNAFPPETPRILVATGKLIGEGFDHPPLDTLVLAMPISWRGTLQQYAGRLHRDSIGKGQVRIIDFVDTGHPALILKKAV